MLGRGGEGVLHHSTAAAAASAAAAIATSLAPPKAGRGNDKSAASAARDLEWEGFDLFPLHTCRPPRQYLNLGEHRCLPTTTLPENSPVLLRLLGQADDNDDGDDSTQQQHEHCNASCGDTVGVMKLHLSLIALGAAGALAAPIDSDGRAGVAGLGARSDLSLAGHVPHEARFLGIDSFKNWWRKDKDDAPKGKDKDEWEKDEKAAEKVSDDPPDKVEDEVEDVEKEVEKNKDNPGWIKKQWQGLQPFINGTWAKTKALGSSIASSSALEGAVSAAMATAASAMIGGMTEKKIAKLDSKERKGFSSNFIVEFLKAVPSLGSKGAEALSSSVLGSSRNTGILKGALSAVRPVKTT